MGDGTTKRNEAFHPGRQPLKHHPDFWHAPHRIRGPISFLNPTRAHFQPQRGSARPAEPSSSSGGLEKRRSKYREADHGISYKWTSRNNRKGRHALAVNPSIPLAELPYLAPPFTASVRETFRGIQRMFTVFPVWDVSYDVATIFTVGSVIWVINACFVYLPLVQPDTEFKNEILYGGGITAFIGATIFEIGSFFLMAEAVNENRTGCFSWALEQALSHDAENGVDGIHLRPSELHCTHHHINKYNLVGKQCNKFGHVSTKPEYAASSSPSPRSGSRNWIWFPSKEEIRTHYIHDLGFLASFSQLVGATIFWVSGLSALPGIYNHMSRPVTIIFYWTPQVLGGLGFVISGALFTLETQSHWYKPAFKTLGWWIGMWNFIGGVGFTLCPAFGYDERSWAQYQASLSTFWGSWAFLMGSVIQWYESLDKYPVEVDRGDQSDEGSGDGKR
ncbi:integral membrane protein [Lojkania enalia]|uniref:Integral membrane protein n=1 Tax=Lojkania enalia TaxID=147567 RepID=A0A9P4N531_9PLEO|nr:integral membrane protein [Didymosphaeria enalia]